MNTESLNSLYADPVELSRAEIIKDLEEGLRNTLVLLGSEYKRYGDNLISQGSYNQISNEPIEATREKGDKIEGEILQLRQKMNALQNRLTLMRGGEETFRQAA